MLLTEFKLSFGFNILKEEKQIDNFKKEWGHSDDMTLN